MLIVIIIILDPIKEHTKLSHVFSISLKISIIDCSKILRLACYDILIYKLLMYLFKSFRQ